jgi:Tol biopolymer transport system component
MENGHRFPQFLPGGRQFLYYTSGTPETAGIHLGSLDSSGTKRLAPADTAGVYSPDGWLFFIREGTLVAQRLDLGSGELTGDPLTVADPVVSVLNAGAFSISGGGLVAYRSGEVGQQRQLVWFDRAGKTLGTLGGPDSNGMSAPSLAPDGRRAAVHRTVQGNRDIWLLDGTRTSRFTFDPSPDSYAIWSPDGSRIAFDSNRKGRRDLYVKPSNLAGGEELVLESAQSMSVNDWSSDGRFLQYVVFDPQTLTDLWVLPLEGDRKPFVFLKTNFEERRSQFSPNGRWLAYMSNESGPYEIYVRPFNGTTPVGAAGGQWQVSTSGGIDPRWRADGRELYYIAPDGKLMAAPIAASGATFEAGAPVALFQTRVVGGGSVANVGFQYAVAADGRFLVNTVLQDAASPITLLQNWAAGVRK